VDIVDRRGRVMASELHLLVLGPPAHALDEAVAHLEHLERCWSRFLPTSDVTRLNESAGVPVEVDPSTLTLLATMVEAWRLTAGGYDPTMPGALAALGYGPGPASGPSPLGRHDRQALLAGVDVDPVRSVARFPVGLAVDPGGIGKGLAADLAVRFLLDRGAAGALVSIGGDLAMGGTAPDAAGWTILVEHPDRARPDVAELHVSGGGVATSSTRSRRWTHDGREHHHQLDPDRGLPSDTDLAAATVVAPTGWQAEAHATAALARGRDAFAAYLGGHGLSGVAVDDRGGLVASTDLAALLVPVEVATS